MPSIKALLARFTLLALIGLFLVPGIAFWFTGHAEQAFSAELRREVQRSLAAERDQAGMSVASLCNGEHPALAALRADVCRITATYGQFHLARRVSGGLLLLGLGTLGLIAALALAAYHAPRQQTRAFVAGWWSLRAISAIEIALQGALLVWLSYWLTAYFFELYAVKLILVAAVLAAMGVFVALKAIFARVPMENAVSGELLDEAQAPALWARIRQFADRVGTEPPKQVIGGIDANFFVTEAPLQVQDRVAAGRSLFVSLPLLRAIDREEADAVLAHELAHFRGGDTEAGAALGPKLNAYAHYMEALQHNLLTLLALHVLTLFRIVFELALSRASRAREFAADRLAAEVASPAALSRALIRIGAYSHYRATVEHELFSHAARHEASLQLGDRVAQGLSAFTQSEQFSAALIESAMPHPFDSHPPLEQRLQNIAVAVSPGDFPAIAGAAPASSWIDYIPAASEIETRLWQAYEAQFAAQHELSLAVRYEPANDAERAIVLKHFPDVEFALKKGKVLRITYRGVENAASTIGWDDVVNLNYEDGSFGSVDVLTLTHPEKGLLGARKSTKLKIAIAAKERERLKGTLGHYWQRHQTMRLLQAGGAGG